MFIQLPIYFAAGALLYSAWRHVLRRFFPPSGTPWWLGRERLWPAEWFIFVAVVLVILGIGFTAAFASAISASLAIGGAAVLAGWHGSAWLAHSKDAGAANIRERGLAITAVSLFVALAAAEHDAGILEKLTKVSFGGFNLELGGAGGGSGGGRESGASTPQMFASGSSGENRHAALPGTARIDYVTNRLATFGERMLRDEQYAQMLIFDDKTSAERDPLGYSLTRYLCNKGKIGRLVSMLDMLQEHHRSQSSYFADDAQLIILLRSFYYEETKAWAEISSLHDKNDIENQINELFGRRNLIGNSLGKEFQDLYRNADLGLNQLGEEAVVAASPLCEKLHNQTPIEPIYPPVPRRSVPIDTTVYFGYLAFLTALANVSVGHVESAVTLLDQRILKESDLAKALRIRIAADPANGSIMFPETCQGASEAKRTLCISYVRKQLLIMRLLQVQSDLIVLTQSPLLRRDAINITEKFIEVAESLFIFVDPEKKLRESLFRKKDRVGATCAANGEVIDNRGFDRSAFIRLMTAHTSSKNTLVWLAAIEPESFVLHPKRRENLDRFSDEISAFDLECAVEAHALRSVSDLSGAIAHSVGLYLEAKARAPALMSPFEWQASENERIKWLCGAQENFQKAAEELETHARERRRETGKKDIGIEATDAAWDDDSFRYALANARLRIGASLENIRKEKLEKICGK